MYVRETAVVVLEKKKPEMSAGAAAFVVICIILGGVYGGWPGGIGAFFVSMWLVSPSEKPTSGS